MEKIEAALNKLMMDRLVFLTKLRENIKQSKSRRVLELWGMMDELVDEDAAEFEQSLLHSLLLQVYTHTHTHTHTYTYTYTHTHTHIHLSSSLSSVSPMINSPLIAALELKHGSRLQNLT